MPLGELLHPGPVLVVAWSPDGRTIANCSRDQTVRLWDVEQGSYRAVLHGHRGEVWSIAFTADSRSLLSGGGELFVWDTQTGQRLSADTEYPGTVTAVVWASDNLLVSGGSDGLLRWWDVRSGERLGKCEAHQGMVHSLRRSPDGRMLASCGDNGAIRLWESQSGQYLRTLRRDRPYERLNITGIRGLSEAQKASLHVLGALDDAAQGG